jgi:hypothetical protein
VAHLGAESPRRGYVGWQGAGEVKTPLPAHPQQSRRGGVGEGGLLSVAPCKVQKVPTRSTVGRLSGQWQATKMGTREESDAYKSPARIGRG